MVAPSLSCRRSSRSKRDLDVFISHQSFGLNGRYRIFLDHLAGGLGQIHHHGYASLGIMGQVDMFYRSLVNPTYAYIRAGIKTGNIVKV